MINKILAISSFIFFLYADKEYMSLSEAKAFASRYYANIEKTVRTGKEPTSKKDYIEMFGCNANGFPLYSAVNSYPNYLFLLDNNEERSPCSDPETIFGEIASYQECNNITFNYRCSATKYCRPPELKKDEDAPQFAQIHFRTKWRINGGKNIIIDDTVYVNLVHKYISQISNKIAPMKVSSIESLEEMMSAAIVLYSNGKHSDAYEMYHKIVKKYPNNNDAWYALGVMYFKGQGVGILSKKQRLQMAYKCWSKSDLKKARRAISFITDGRE